MMLPATARTVLLLLLWAATGCFSLSQQSARRNHGAVPHREELHHDPFGPPPTIADLQVGATHVSAFTKQYHSEAKLRRLSLRPNIFLLKRFVAEEDCCAIMEQAASEMKPAETTEGDGKVLRRNCRVAWIDNGQPRVKALGRTTGNLLLSDPVKISPGAGCEQLQVLNYFEEGGEFILHHDGVGRVLTVIYYLNGVAGTWFPLADRGDLVGEAIPKNRNEALELVKDCTPGRDGLLVVGQSSPLLKDSNPKNVVVVEAGDAIAFYNYFCSDGGNSSGESADWRSLHAGLPTTAEEGEKWIANHWMHAPGLFRNVKTHFQA